LLTGGRAHEKRHFLSGSALHMEGCGRHQNLDTFVPKNSPQLVRDIWILTVHELRAMG
jgi:hypothetical protein